MLPILLKENGYYMMKVMLLLIACVLLLSGCVISDIKDISDNSVTVAPEQEGSVPPNNTAEPTTEASNDTHPAELAFLYDFTKYGYSAEQVDSMQTILLNVGITEITELEIGNVSYGMQVIKGLAFTTGELAAPKQVHIQFNIENGAIYLASIYCPSYGTSNQQPYLSGLEDRRADLYYDVDGGYLKKIDWESKTLVDYDKA
jgi:hypothetical protein